MERLLHNWGKKIYSWRWYVLVIWMVLIALGGALGGQLGELLSGGGWDIKGSHSERAKQLLTQSFDGRAETSLTLVIHDEQKKIGEVEFEEQIRIISQIVKEESIVESVYGLTEVDESLKSAFISEEGDTAIASIQLNVDEDFAGQYMEELQEKISQKAEELGIEAYLVGTPVFYSELGKLSQEGLIKAELIAFPLILVILFLVFRSLVASITPVMVTVASVLVSMGIIYVVAQQIELSMFITNAAVMLGLGVGIDYSLFMVNRFRQELKKMNDPIAAMARTMETAGHTVFFSAITVIAAMSALFIVEVAAIRAIAFGAVVVVIIAGMASLSLLPAILVMLGDRINYGKIPFFYRNDAEKPSNGWKRWASLMMRRPVLFLIITVMALLLMAIPANEMKMFNPDIRILPEDSNVRKGVDLIQTSFGTGTSSPISVTLELMEGDWSSPDHWRILTQVHHELLRQEHVKSVNSPVSIFQEVDPLVLSSILTVERINLPVELIPMVNRYLSRDNKVVVFDIISTTYASSEETKALVLSLRDEVLPMILLPEGVTYAIGGETMGGIDVNEVIEKSLFPSLMIMLALIYLILLLSFKSVFLPLKAIAMNLLSVAATYGVLVFVFAQGNGAELFHVEANGYIVNFVPVLLLALLFGLSTDYEVFLISRVKEEYDLTGKHDESVMIGIEQTGPLITGAAVLMIAVFTGFAFSGVLPIATLGFGMAVAIFIDATIIRMVLVPVSMKLLGRYNWWFPTKKQIVRFPAKSRPTVSREY